MGCLSGDGQRPPGPDVGGHCLSVILATPETDIGVGVFLGGCTVIAAHFLLVRVGLLRIMFRVQQSQAIID